MRKSTMLAAAGLLAFGSAAFAAEDGPSTQTTTGNGAARMQGSPNAAGFGKGETGKGETGKGETTGSTMPGAASNAPGQEMKQDGKMHGSPNASGFKGDSTR